jgi:hypothetical protein
MKEATAASQAQDVVLGYRSMAFLASDGVLSLSYVVSLRPTPRRASMVDYANLAPSDATSYLTFGPNSAISSTSSPPRWPARVLRRRAASPSMASSSGSRRLVWKNFNRMTWLLWLDNFAPLFNNLLLIQPSGAGGRRSKQPNRVGLFG